jgi:hypothetical protein
VPVVYREVEVEFDVSDLDSDEVVDACRELGYSVIKTGKDNDTFEEDINSLADSYRRNDIKLMEQLRLFLQDYTGRIL